MAYLDTSVLVACYVPEALSAKAQREAQRAESLLVSTLTEVELVSALSQKIRMGHLSRSDGQRVEALFQTHIQDGRFQIASPSAKEFQLARGWIAQYSTPLRTLDALHLALAHSNQEILITADRSLADSAKVLGVKFRYVST